jgi:hypothetical protein
MDQWMRFFFCLDSPTAIEAGIKHYDQPDLKIDCPFKYHSPLAFLTSFHVCPPLVLQIIDGYECLRRARGIPLHSGGNRPKETAKNHKEQTRALFIVEMNFMIVPLGMAKKLDRRVEVSTKKKKISLFLE